MTETSVDAHPETQRIKARELSIDTRVQRDHLDQAKLNKIRSGFREQSLQTLQVSQRKDGSKKILDGWHRWMVVCELMGEDYELNCQVFTGLDLEQEAALFLEFNQQGAADRLDKHKVRATLKDPVALAINEVCDKNGWTVGYAPGMIRAIAELEAIYYRGEAWIDGFGPTLLHNTLAVVTNAWGRDDPKVVGQSVLKAVAQFLLILDQHWVDRDAGKQIDFDRMISALTKLKKGPSGWVEGCRGQAKALNKALQVAMLQSLYDLYNKEDRAGRLPQQFRAV
jgi:hypothetical protein